VLTPVENNTPRGTVIGEITPGKALKDQRKQKLQLKEIELKQHESLLPTRTWLGLDLVQRQKPLVAGMESLTQPHCHFLADSALAVFHLGSVPLRNTDRFDNCR
jgi:hypothetical protein